MKGKLYLKDRDEKRMWKLNENETKSKGRLFEYLIECYQRGRNEEREKEIKHHNWRKWQWRKEASNDDTV